MIVVAILAIITAIALPSLAGSRRSANEAATVSSLRTLSTISNAYRTRFQSYSPDLASLGAAGYIDSVLASGTKSGYSFTYAGASDSWNVTAVPAAAGVTGDRGFFVDDSGVIRYSASGAATSASTPVD